MASSVPYRLRPACGDDLNFIYSTWLDSYRYDSTVGKSHKNSIFFSEYRKVIDNILAHELTKVVIACFPESEETILAYLVHEPHILHYVYTKGPFQRQGLASELIDKIFPTRPITYSHETFTAFDLVRHNPDFIHNGIMLFNKGD